MHTESSINFEFDLVQKFGFSSHQMNIGYKKIGNILLRIKNHEANYAYFVEDAEDGYISKIVSVNYTDTSCGNKSRMTKDDFANQFPNIDVVELNFNYEDISLEEAEQLIRENI